MKKFVIRVLIFCFSFLLLITLALFIIPNKKIENNSLFANIDKHNRLDSLPSPKIIFVGGSNLAYGLDSKEIEDRIGLPVVNMGLHAGFGMKFMMNEVIPSVKKGDIVVLSPEYHHFYSDVFWGEKVLVALLFDVDKRNFRFIDIQQFAHLFPNTIEYGVSKLMLKQIDIMDAGGGDTYERVYMRNSFNKYGDENMHWTYPNEKMMGMAVPAQDVQLNEKAIKSVANFKNKVEKNQATFILLPPAFQQTSYSNYLPVINKINDALVKQNTPFVLDTSEGAFADSLFFNTIFHLNKEGVDLRTSKVMKILEAETN